MISQKINWAMDLGITLTGVSIRSFRDELPQYPVAEFNGKPLLLDSLDRVSSEEILLGTFSSNIGPINIKDQKLNLL